MPLTIERNDLAAMEVDAVVVAANERLVIDGGAALAVAKAAGFADVRAACEAIGSCPAGSAVATPGFSLPAKVIVHAVGPMWRGGGAGEEALLRSAYVAALACASDAGARSVALPLISSGARGFPPGIALAVARDAIRSFLDDHEMDVHLVLFDKEAFAAGLASYHAIAEYIDDRYVGAHLDSRRRGNLRWDGDAEGTMCRGGRVGSPLPSGVDTMPAPSVREEPDGEMGAARSRSRGLSRIRKAFSRPRRRSGSGLDMAADAARDADSTARFDAVQAPGEDAAEAFGAPGAAETLASLAPKAKEGRSLEDLLDSLDEPFSTTLLALIDARGLDDVRVYKRANMSRQLFSKIRSDASYRPTKKTVLALAVALELDLDETDDLLQRAGYALSPASKADVIVEYFIAAGNYDIFEINEALYAFDQPLL